MADLGRAGLDDRRRDRQRFGDGIDLELEVERQRLRRAQRDVVGDWAGRNPAASTLDPVEAVGQVRNDIDAGVGRRGLRLDVGLHIGGDHGRADEDTARGVGDRAVEL